MRAPPSTRRLTPRARSGEDTRDASGPCSRGGFERNLTDGILRSRYRNDPERQELMTPGEVYRFTLEPFPTANVFQKGHRIRVDVSSSNFPRFDVNPNTGEPLGRDRRIESADNTLYHDASRPSHLVLPVLERK